ELADALPDVAEILVPPRRRLLPPRAGVEVVDRVLEERVLVADDLLEGGAVDQGARDVLGLAPRDVVEVVVLESAVEIVRVAEARVRAAVPLPVAVAQRV